MICDETALQAALVAGRGAKKAVLAVLWDRAIGDVERILVAEESTCYNVRQILKRQCWGMNEEP